MSGTPNGKAFEYEFSRSLKAMPGYSFRLLDGGANVRIKQPGDFIYCGEITWLIECKNTKRKSFPFANIQGHQLHSLLCWDGSRGPGWDFMTDEGMQWVETKSRASLVAIRYETEKRMFLVPIHDLIGEMRNSGRASLNVERAAEIGIECKKKGGVWDLGMP